MPSSAEACRVCEVATHTLFHYSSMNPSSVPPRVGQGLDRMRNLLSEEPRGVGGGCEGDNARGAPVRGCKGGGGVRSVGEKREAWPGRFGCGTASCSSRQS